LRRSHGQGIGLYAIAAIGADETVLAWSGEFISGAEIFDLSPRVLAHTVQIDDDLFLLGRIDPEPADFVNHSCDPNTGFRGNVVLVAMRPIEVGEAISIDYAMCDSVPINVFACRCGSPRCRGKVNADDWKRRDLQERYLGYFSAYLERRIRKAGWP
jgi:hypothetical protein